MKLIYIADIRMPTEKAHGIQIMKMCEAFAAQNDVELVVPWRFNPIKENPFRYYGIEKNFKITKVPSLDLIKLGKIGFFIQAITFLVSAKIHLLFQKYDILYTRDSLAALFFKDYILEIHSLSQFLLKKARVFVVLTSYIKNELIQKGFDENKILVVADAVDLEKFNINLLKEKARERLNLPQDKKIILYTGHLYKWKGADILAEASRFFSRDALFIFVGGTDKDIRNFQFSISNFQLKNVLLAGHRPHDEIPYWLKAADVLVLPNSAEEKISELYTSPMKMFEYMASGTPIAASDLPSIREVLSAKNAVLVEPDNPDGLADGIRKILDNSAFAERISKQALDDVQNYTWEKRAEKILNFIQNDIH